MYNRVNTVRRPILMTLNNNNNKKSKQKKGRDKSDPSLLPARHNQDYSLAFVTYF